jgi:hypothetical protein
MKLTLAGFETWICFINHVHTTTTTHHTTILMTVLHGL